MDKVAEIVAKRPLAVIIVILLISGIFGYYASQMEMTTDIKSFMPNDEIANAQKEIDDKFGNTEIMQVIYISNNTVDKSTLEDMLRAEEALAVNDKVVSHLKTPDNPTNSIFSPADIVVLGNYTIKFAEKMNTTLENIIAQMLKLNFTEMRAPLENISTVLSDYIIIYGNVISMRDDARTVVLLLFMPHAENMTMPTYVTSIIQNLTFVLMEDKNFEIKSKVLTLLTPPQITANLTAQSNPLLDYFNADMNSTTLNLSQKEIAVRYLIMANNFTYYSLNYTNYTLSQGIYGNEELMNALNATEYNVLTGNNSTALAILNQTILQMTAKINSMAQLLPLYESYNKSLNVFMERFNAGNLTYEDIQSVRENTTQMLKYSTGDWRDMLLIFNQTLNEWLTEKNLFYDTMYEANATQQNCEGYINSYYGSVGVNYTLTDIKYKILNNDAVSNTTGEIDYLKNMLNSSNQQMRQTLAAIRNAMNALNTPFVQWFNNALMDMDYVLRNSPPPVGMAAVNIYNSETAMMNTNTSSTGGTDMFGLFYALKDGFSQPVADTYKEMLQDMFLRETALMNAPPSFDMNFSSMNAPENISFNQDMSPLEKLNYLENMSDEDILSTINKIQTYDPSSLNSTVNNTLNVLNTTGSDMNDILALMNDILNGTWFVYNTTSNDSVKNSISMYSNITTNLTQAVSGMDEFKKNLPMLTNLYYGIKNMQENLPTMFSKDFDGTHAKAAMMLIMINSTWLPGESSSEHMNRIYDVESTIETIVKENSPHSSIRVMSLTYIAKAGDVGSKETMGVLLPISILLVIIILAITLRSPIDTALGLLGIGMAIMWAYGFGVMMGYTFNQIDTTVAILIVGLGIDYGIHSILRYREELRKGKDVRTSMKEMITHLGMALILATITTVVAFLSNVSSPLPPIYSFGIMNAVGIIAAFIIFTTFIPAVKILIDGRREKKGTLKIKKDRTREGSGVVAINKFMALGAMGAEHHWKGVIAAVLIITVVSAYGAMQLQTGFNMNDFIPHDMAVADTIQFMSDNFNNTGMNNNYILIKGNLTSSETLLAVKRTMDNIKDDEYVQYPKCQSITTLISEWMEKNTTFYQMVVDSDTNGDGLPDKNITGIYNWLYDHTDEARYVLHKSGDTYDAMLIVVPSTASTDSENKVIYEQLQADAKPLKDAGLQAIPTGAGVLTYHIMESLKESEWNSVIITIAVSYILLTAIFFYQRRSLVLGIITSLPVTLAFIWIMGTMFALGINFNAMTITDTSLTIGLGITYAIHITHRFLEDRDRESSVEDAIRKTLRHTGTSIFGASTTTMAAFGTLILSTMDPIKQFGEIAGLSILYSFLLSVFILPTFLYLWAKYRERKDRSENEVDEERVDDDVSNARSREDRSKV